MQNPGGGNNNGKIDNKTIEKISNLQMSDQIQNLQVLKDWTIFYFEYKRYMDKQ